MLTPTRTRRIRGTASAAKHTANQNTTTVATTSAGRNAPRGATQTDQRAQLAPMTTSPTKLQPPRLLLAPTPTQPTPIRSAASAAAHLAHEHNAPSDSTHPETQTILARSTASASITSPTSLPESLPSGWCQLHLTGRRRSRAPYMPSVTSPTKIPPPLPKRE